MCLWVSGRLGVAVAKGGAVCPANLGLQVLHDILPLLAHPPRRLPICDAPAQAMPQADSCTLLSVSATLGSTATQQLVVLHLARFPRPERPPLDPPALLLCQVRRIWVATVRDGPTHAGPNITHYPVFLSYSVINHTTALSACRCMRLNRWAGTPAAQCLHHPSCPCLCRHGHVQARRPAHLPTFFFSPP